MREQERLRRNKMDLLVRILKYLQLHQHLHDRPTPKQNNTKNLDQHQQESGRKTNRTWFGQKSQSSTEPDRTFGPCRSEKFAKNCTDRPTRVNSRLCKAIVREPLVQLVQLVQSQLVACRRRT